MAEEPATVGVSLAGREAADCLRALAADGGSVLAVFRRSVYLSHDGSGAIACIGPAALGAGPLNALAGPDRNLPDWQEAGLRPGDPVAPFNGGARIAALRFVTFAGTRLHDPPLGPCEWTGDGLAAALARLSDALSGFDLDEGLAPLARPHGSAFPGGPPILRRARPAISALESWLAEGANTPPPRAAVERLIGLGPGLTPSGDDYLGGAMIALSMCGYANQADALAGPALASATDGTNRISAGHLRAAAKGLGADALHRSVDALARGDDRALAAGLRGLDAIGHSSGWDALAGAVSALKGIDRRLRAQPRRSAAAVSAAPALDSATTTPASRNAST